MAEAPSTNGRGVTLSPRCPLTVSRASVLRALIVIDASGGGQDSEAAARPASRLRHR